MLRTACFITLAATFAVAGCAVSDEPQALPPPKKNFDAGPDTSNTDTSNTDTSTTDTATDTSTETSESCTPLTTEKKACGKCGTMTRTCSSSGVWNEWSACTDEKSFTDCSIGEVRVTDCGKCGTQKDTCDETTCTWTSGACLGEPSDACEPGATETSTASCPTLGEVRTRECTAKCTWGPYGACTLPKGWIKMTAPTTTVLDGRYWATGVWTGTEMLVWGGYGTSLSFPTYNIRSNGAAYNLTGDSWTALPSAPSTLSSGRWQHTAVWTGSRMVIWGGLNYYLDSTSYASNTGAAYDPSTKTWTAIATPTISARYRHGAVWSTTTNEMIVWGGYGTCAGTYCNDGAAYDPLTNTWTTLPAAPIAGRHRHSMIWTGTELVIWGGQGSSGFLRDGARYDPKTKVWTKFPDPPAEIDGRYDNAAVWSGKEMLIYGGYSTYTLIGGSYYYGRPNGARYLPGGSWSMFANTPDDAFGTGTSKYRYSLQAWFGNGKLYLWSGVAGTSSIAGAGGATFDPATDKWTAMDTTGAPIARNRAVVVWTGKEAIVWGGSSSYSGGSFYNDGAVYRP